LNEQGTTLWHMGRLEPAIEAYAEALVIYRALRLPRQEARALNNMGNVFAALGEYEEALAHYKSSLKLDQQLGDRSGVALKLGNIGQAYADLGDVDRAESYLAKAWKLGEQTGDPSSMADAAISWGQAKLARGDSPARSRCSSAARSSPARTASASRRSAASSTSRWPSSRPTTTPTGALELARSATELARKMPMMVGVIYGLAITGLAHARRGDHAAAVAATAEAVALMPSTARPEGAEHIWYWHGLTLAGAGRSCRPRAPRSSAPSRGRDQGRRLRDPALKAAYLGSKTARAVAAALGRD
jgi:tetratricopeptide (TPR) repeat protein